MATWSSTSDPNIWTGKGVHFDRVNTGDWWVPAPRISAVYDLTGKGTTVLKASFGRYN